MRDQLLGYTTEQNLATVSGRQEPGDTVERSAKVVAVTNLNRAGVQRHTHPQWARRAPAFRVERTLRSQGRNERLRRVGKRGIKGISAGSEDHSPMCGDG